MPRARKDVVGDSGMSALTKGMKRRQRRLEQRLEHVRDVEAKRTRQLEKARQRGAALEARLAALEPAQSPADAVTGSRPSPQAYCMREKQMVSMLDPQAIVMRNGRAALSGTCPSCGAHVVTTARAAMAPTANGHVLSVET